MSMPRLADHMYPIPREELGWSGFGLITTTWALRYLLSVSIWGNLALSSSVQRRLPDWYLVLNFSYFEFLIFSSPRDAIAYHHCVAVLRVRRISSGCNSILTVL
jgi:hypothetical protein